MGGARFAYTHLWRPALQNDHKPRDSEARTVIENWLREPPEWFLNLMTGVAFGLAVFGVGLMIWGLVSVGAA
jgi:hypothetical protein